jgi:hypothetical protein
MVTPAAKREAVAHLQSEFEVSERRACTVLEVDRTSVRYRSLQANDDAIRVRLRALASIRRRFSSGKGTNVALSGLRCTIALESDPSHIVTAATRWLAVPQPHPGQTPGAASLLFKWAKTPHQSARQKPPRPPAWRSRTQRSRCHRGVGSTWAAASIGRRR